MARMGPTGRHGGDGFDIGPIPDGNVIQALHIRHGRLVDGITIDWGPYNGPPVNDPSIPREAGGGGGSPTDITIRMQAPNQPDNLLLGIDGTYGDSIDTITAHGTQFDVGPLGGGGPAQFWYEAVDGYHIVGFFGTTGDDGSGHKVLQSLGVYIRPIAGDVH